MFNSLIRFRLEYCSLTWSPSVKYLIDKIECVQKKYLKFMCFKFRFPYNVPYLPLCKNMKFQTLYHRHNVCDLVTLNKLMNNKIDYSPLVRTISFNVPWRRLRSEPCFQELYRLNIRRNSPLVHCQRLVNSMNLYMFKKNARRLYGIEWVLVVYGSALCHIVTSPKYTSSRSRVKFKPCVHWVSSSRVSWRLVND